MMSYSTANSKSFNLNIDLMNLFYSDYQNDRKLNQLMADSTHHV